MRYIELASLTVMSLFYIAAGLNHFADPDFYLALMPPYVPAHEAAVFASGVAEVALGLALWIPAWRRWAAWGLIALLIAVFPANLHMALHDISPDGVQRPSWIAWARLPFQAVLIAWAWWHTRPARSARPLAQTS